LTAQVGNYIKPFATIQAALTALTVIKGGLSVGVSYNPVIEVYDIPGGYNISDTINIEIDVTINLRDGVTITHKDGSGPLFYTVDNGLPINFIIKGGESTKIICKGDSSLSSFMRIGRGHDVVTLSDVYVQHLITVTGLTQYYTIYSDTPHELIIKNSHIYTSVTSTSSISNVCNL